MESGGKLQLLLAHDDDGSPFLEDGLPGGAADVAAKVDTKVEALSHWEEGGDVDSLEDQGWGVIAPEGEAGQRLLDRIRPLIEARAEDQGGREVKIYRAPAKISPADAARWRKQVVDKGDQLSTDVPRYQLILGDLDQVPLSIQQGQGSDAYVGRLCFRDERGYEAYVEKVLRAERARVEARPRAQLFTVHDGTAATMIGYRALMKPGFALLAERGFDTADVGDRDAPSPSEFLAAAEGPDPTVMFSVSHGAGAPRGGWRSYEEQRDRQGAMSFGRAGKLTAADVGDRPFLPGGIWFMLACYGAGTPDASAYRQWLERLKQAGQFGGNAQSVLAGLPASGDPPFIAALPQAALANPSGPLAVIGHIDLAWTYSFEERDSGAAVGRPAKLMEVIRSALLGDRVGISYRELVRWLTLANHELTELASEADRAAEGTPQDLGRLGHLWMLRQDLAGYILLGDPALRAPFMRGRKGRRAPAERAPALARPASLPAQAPAAKAGIDIDALEKAIGHVLIGDEPDDVASRHGLDRAELRRLADAYRKGGRAAIGEK